MKAAYLVIPILIMAGEPYRNMSPDGDRRPAVGQRAGCASLYPIPSQSRVMKYFPTSVGTRLGEETVVRLEKLRRWGWITHLIPALIVHGRLFDISGGRDPLLFGTAG